MPTLPRLNPIHLPSSAVSLPPRAMSEEAPVKIGTQRLRSWEISSTYHCSIIGTCLTAGELRRTLVKSGLEEARTASDHIVHGWGVGLAGQNCHASKVLNKALDKRHESSIKQIPRHADEDELRKIWRESFDRGDIAGPYWALMSHPATPPALTRGIFGEVHMLSHLIGSASRLDIARLSRLENELEQEREKGARQEMRLSAAAAERVVLQRRIQQLDERVIQAEAVAASIAQRAVPEETATVRPEAETTVRANVLSLRLAEAEAMSGALQRQLEQLRDLNQAILRENETLEATVAAQMQNGTQVASAQANGPVLYVGGRRNLFDHLRACAESYNVDLLLHDGGMEDNTTLLPALVGQASTILFPVDHISHTAAGLVKRLCREQGKPYLPLRSAGLASFLTAITDKGIPG